MTNGAPRVSVIIPNWNGARWLRTCLGALRQQNFTDFRVIVVDNGSTDESRDLVGREFPEVRVLPLESNLGFVGACNIGMKEAQSEILVLLNNDTEAEPDWLLELVRALDANPRAGMAACKLRLYAERDKLHSAGDFYRVSGIPGNRGVWQVDSGQYDTPDGPLPLFGPCGGAVAYRRSMLDEIGLFDGDLISYCEDVDLNWRARLAGYACAYAPRSIVYHQVSATGGGSLASYYVGRNFILVLAKDYPTALWKKYWTRIVSAQLRITLNALRNWRGAAARARLRGQLSGLWNLPRFLRKRRAVQAMRRVTSAELETVLAPPER